MIKVLEHSNIQRGLATLEMLLAMAILVSVISALAPVVWGGQDGATGSQTNQEALYKAKELLEISLAAARQDISLVKNCDDATLTPCPGTTDNFYKRTLTVLAIDSLSKQATATVSWQNHSVALSTIVTDTASALGQCNLALAEDWQHPAHYDFNSYDLISAATGNHTDGLTITDIKIYRQKLYLAAGATANNGFTLYIFSLPQSPDQMPSYLGGTDNALSLAAGLNALSIAPYQDKLYAYAASAYTGASASCAENNNCAQLQVFDVTDSAHPRLVKNVKIPALTVDNKLAAGNAVAYQNGYVYLGVTKVASTSTYGEFTVVDVGGGGNGASPANPIIKGTYFVDNGVNAILAKGNYVYLAHPTTSASSPREQLTVLDISDPSHPSRVSGWHAPDNQGNGKSIFLSGDNLYLGRTVTTTVNPEFYILHNTDPANLAANNPNPPGQKIHSSVNGLAVRGSDALRLAFLTTNSQFQIWDISQPSAISAYTSLPLQAMVTAAQGNGVSASGSSVQTCVGNNFYLGVQTSVGNKDILSFIGPGS